MSEGKETAGKALFATSEGIRSSDIRSAIEDRLTESGSSFYEGPVELVGRDSNGSYLVTYSANGLGYGSEWPEWAYGPAHDAMLAGKRLFVAAGGDPTGANLIYVMITTNPV